MTTVTTLDFEQQ